MTTDMETMGTRHGHEHASWSVAAVLLALALVAFPLLAPATVASAQPGQSGGTEEHHDNSGHVTITSLLNQHGNGHTDLSRYQCTPGVSADCNHDCKVFDTPIPGCGPYPPVDPTESARQLVLNMQLQPPPMCFVPGKADTGAVGVTGMHAWGWICQQQIRDNTVGPLHRTIVAPGMVITATAVNTSVLVNWGDGSVPTLCAGALLPFTPYVDIVDAGPGTPATGTPSPTCGHKIDRSSVTEPDRVFHGTATSNWIVYWHATAGLVSVAGTVPMPLTSHFVHRVGEVQVLNNGPGR